MLVCFFFLSFSATHVHTVEVDIVLLKKIFEIVSGCDSLTILPDNSESVNLVEVLPRKMIISSGMLQLLGNIGQGEWENIAPVALFPVPSPP